MTESQRKEFIAFINLPDCIDPDTGESYRTGNLKKQHSYPIGSLVELEEGVRLFVVAHRRDCDGTPLYSLGIEPDTLAWSEESDGYLEAHNGYPEDGLTLIR